VDASHQRGQIVVATPIFTGPLLISAAPKLIQLIRAAQHAKALHRRHGPVWAQPLPVCELERIKMFCDESLPLNLLGFYSLSLLGRDYDFWGHPQFLDHARAVMADPRTPAYLREDRELREAFPPKPLAGLDEHGRWRPLPNRASRLIEGPAELFRKQFAT
jgi:hypothetical protein